MNVYRWYTEALHISGVTCARTMEIAKEQAEDYLREVFPWDADELYDRGYINLELQVWPITEDDDYCSKHPLTIATQY